MDNRIVIAIDGHSSCGKSTMAKALARKIGYIYVDSGAMYRAVTLYCMQHALVDNGQVLQQELRGQIDQIHIAFKLNAVTGVADTYLNGVNVESEIRSIEVSNLVSPVATIDFVRHILVEQQQQMGLAKGIVMDGRDVGTTVFPNAELKIFVTASAEVRAQRRYAELQKRGMPASMEAILNNVQERDYIDSHRIESPLRKADDACLLDNSQMTIEQQDQWLMDQFNRVVSSISNGKD